MPKHAQPLVPFAVELVKSSEVLGGDDRGHRDATFSTTTRVSAR